MSAVGMGALQILLLTYVLLVNFTHSESKKNVVLIFGDDAGFQMGAYNNTACKTPNFDKLAARSIVFKHGYTSVSSCSPSRSVLLTGLPQHQNGMYGLQHEPHHFSSLDAVQSLPVILDTAGIRTGIIGKKHVAPDTVYKFDYAQTEENNDMNQVGRNITYMRNYVRQFLQQKDDRPFFLYLAFHDPHRCNNIPLYGQFCEKFGNRQPGMGVIPDWTPSYYKPEDVEVPYFLPDTLTTRQDLANMYTTYSRMDQGIGLFLGELEAAGHMNDTLILYTADNGIPFPGAKTNLYDPGQGEPMMISSPLHKESWGTVSDALGSTMDFTPTILDWFGVNYPQYNMLGRKVQLTGKSLLPVTVNPDTTAEDFTYVFSSHDLHEVTMYYPMRVLRTTTWKLIHNLNFEAPYPIAVDCYQSPSYLEIINKTMAGQKTGWFRDLEHYYYRDQWELFHLDSDPMELINLAYTSEYRDVFTNMQNTLLNWQNVTNDPWICSPTGVLEKGKCMTLFNGAKQFGRERRSSEFLGAGSL
ncbi:N-sulphoglucosamine sulphohydrolase-like [Haliotis rufescens]|uniref:N-sulphoglucosamine sulphohydrolase-like n=1 Tax=Haliotis rufescens TaxID=6454 RepID=UPI00201F437D|nr:N-sulphoglucosamine sulphohydrolase-like [Haliotis rufescens]